MTPLELIQKTIDYIDEHVQEKIAVEDLAALSYSCPHPDPSKNRPIQNNRNQNWRNYYATKNSRKKRL